MAKQAADKITESHTNGQALPPVLHSVESHRAEGSERPKGERPFPASTFEDALPIAAAIHQLGAGGKVRRLTLFEHLQRAPDSGGSRQLITNSSRYGITSGGYKAEYIELTSDGALASSPEASAPDQIRARFRLAIEQIPPFKAIYERFKNNKLPLAAILRDFLVDLNIDASDVQQCIDTFIVNAKFVGVLKPLAGAERILTLDHALDDLPKQGNDNVAIPARPVRTGRTERAHSPNDFETTCFYVTPIGEDLSEQRAHSDLFMGSLIEPAMEQLGLTVVRADQIAKSGMITSQVIEHLKRSRLVIADLSFLNPNVFWEMAIRHSCKLPIVQIIRKTDRLPFDVNQVRTIVVDTTSIYTLVPQLDTYRADIATQARAALDDPAGVSNPLTAFYPDFWLS